MPLDGKTTWVFSGRIHHFQKLSCVVDRLRELGCDARYYVSDNAIGMMGRRVNGVELKRLGF